MPVEDGLDVVSPVDADALAAAGTVELLDVVPDPPHPHVKSASATATAKTLARTSCRVVGVSLMISPPAP